MKKMLVTFDVGEYFYSDYVNAIEEGDFGLNADEARGINFAIVRFSEFLIREYDYSGSICGKIFEKFSLNVGDINYYLELYSDYNEDDDVFVNIRLFPLKQTIEVTCNHYEGLTEYQISTFENVDEGFISWLLSDIENVKFLYTFDGLVDLSNEELRKEVMGA